MKFNNSKGEAKRSGATTILHTVDNPIADLIKCKKEKGKFVCSVELNGKSTKIVAKKVKMA